MKTKSIISILFTAALFTVVSCKKDKDPEPTPSTAGLDIYSSYQVSFSVDGTNVSYTSNSAAADMGYATNHTIVAAGLGNSEFRYTGTLSLGSSGKSFSVEKGAISLPGGTAPTNSEFLNFFQAGTCNYSPGANTGVVIFYFDGLTMWSSETAPADQTGSAFTIVDKKEITGRTNYTVKIYATFNCKVYDGAGNSKVITNGKYIGDFENI